MASAIAVTFTLLILALMIGEYTANVLPQQLQTAEYQHTLQVEDEMAQIQADILAEAANPSLPVTVTAPIQMASQGVPPLGLPASTDLYGLPAPDSRFNLTYYDASVSPLGVGWNSGSRCFGTGSGNCTGSGAFTVYNASVSNTTLTPTYEDCASPVFCQLDYNLTGNYDLLTLTLKFDQPGGVDLQVVGNHDQVTVDFRGNGVGPADNVAVTTRLVGPANSFSANVTTSVTTPPSPQTEVALGTTFSLAQGDFCPAGNAYPVSQFRGITLITPGETGVNATVRWENSQGVVNSHTVTTALGGTPGNSLTFQNASAFDACPFTTATTLSVNQTAVGGFAAHLYNRYFPALTITFEEGAVIAGGPGNTSVMVAPPRFSITPSPLGPLLNLTLVQPLVSGLSAQSGGGVVGVSLKLQGISSFTVLPGGGQYLAFPSLFEIVTPYPGAWLNFFATEPGLFGSGLAHVCHACSLGDPAGTYTVVTPVFAAGLSVTMVTVLVDWN